MKCNTCNELGNAIAMQLEKMLHKRNDNQFVICRYIVNLDIFARPIDFGNCPSNLSFGDLDRLLLKMSSNVLIVIRSLTDSRLSLL